MTTYNFKSLPEQYTFVIKGRTYKIFQLDLRSLQTMVRAAGVMTTGLPQVPEYDLTFEVLARGTVDNIDLSRKEVFEKHFKGKLGEMNTLFQEFFYKSIQDEDETEKSEEAPNE